MAPSRGPWGRRWAVSQASPPSPQISTGSLWLPRGCGLREGGAGEGGLPLQGEGLDRLLVFPEAFLCPVPPSKASGYRLRPPSVFSPGHEAVGADLALSCRSLALHPAGAASDGLEQEGASVLGFAHSAEGPRS